MEPSPLVIRPREPERMNDYENPRSAPLPPLPPPPSLLPPPPPSLPSSSPPNPLTFPRSSQPFSPALFTSPTAEYRGSPLWSWNCALSTPQLLRQIGHLQRMGFGGFHMHVRTGLDTPYLSREFMGVVRACVDEAERRGMTACLYDEDRWPSGAAGGSVVEGRDEFKGRHLLFTPHPYGTVGGVGGCSPTSAEACRSENGWLLARYAVRVGPEGELVSYRTLGRGHGHGGDEVQDGEAVWYAYVETNPPSQWFNGQTYVDTLNPRAMRAFIDSTHEKYRDAVGDRFGTTVPCIFTDEPQFAKKTRLPDGRDRRDVFLPWTDDLPATFAAAYDGRPDLVGGLPELVWNLPGGRVSATRYRFHDHVCERFVGAFMDQLGRWCDGAGILLNGHMMEEPTLGSQTNALGEAMRCYRSMGLPGMDLLSDSVEYTTAKQVSSVARQRGIRGVMSEIYGCTHWYFTFEGHKGCGDWQAALGVTYRVPHLSWASMAGEAKRDYPASLNYQSPWFAEYGYVEDHFARVGVAMTRGRPVTRVAVIHPIESFWCLFGPDGRDEGANGRRMSEREHRFQELTGWLLHGLIDFDFVSESLLPGQYGGVVEGEGEAGAKCTLAVGECRYEVVIVPDLLTIRSTTAKILREFAGRQGKVLSLTGLPSHMDGQELPPGRDRRHLFPYHVVPQWQRDHLLTVLEHEEKVRDIWIHGRDGKRPDTLLYQMRQDGDERFVFVCNTDRTNGIETTICFAGRWEVHVLDTLTGQQTRLAARLTSDGTSFDHKFEGCASVLIRLVPTSTPDSTSPSSFVLSPRSESVQERPPTPSQEVSVTLKDVSLSEPNVLMLDYALYDLYTPDAPAHRSSEVQEILAINNEILDRLGLPRKGQAWRQPWTIPEAERRTRALVTLHLAFRSETDVGSPARLALELPAKITIALNDAQIYARRAHDPPPETWWVDEAIRTVPVPPGTIRKGLNRLTLKFPFGILTDIERIYLLGQFKVRLGPSDPHLLAKAGIAPWDADADAHGLGWGDIVPQHLPFYVGNIVYRCTVAVASRSRATLRVARFESPVLAVAYGDGRRGRIAFQPRQLDLGVLEAGEHGLEITCFGNRYNAFGHVHAQDWMGNCWPDAWRTQGWAWTDEYRVRAVGVLEAPVVVVVRPDDQDGEGSEAEPEDEWVVVSPPRTP